MKHLIVLTLFTLHFSLFTLSTSAALPLKWTVETSRAVPAQFEAYQGETLALEAALQSYGKPLEAPSDYSLYWQTNGMGPTYWSAPCVATASSPSNVLFATWSPTNDVGARAYNCFIGKPGTIYHAAFQLRLRPSPGATPNELPLPQKVIDFAKVTVLNPPWSGGGGGGVDTNAVREIVSPMIDGAIDANEKTGTNRQIVRGEYHGETPNWDIYVSKAYEADVYNGGVGWDQLSFPIDWDEYKLLSGEKLPTYLDSLSWRTTGERTLAQYGITDGATKTELAAKQDALPYPTNAIPASVITGLDAKIDRSVSANLNTYVDGETGVEYVGKFYGGSLYYVPTGNVYPTNN